MFGVGVSRPHVSNFLIRECVEQWRVHHGLKVFGECVGCHRKQKYIYAMKHRDLFLFSQPKNFYCFL